ncbi:hypothetical protein C2G38_376184 [Gigaspora rosea]|uniref:Uncharacterized protein n=1 Tax=Gigaspora rosea TaxID=44941 RepID=A0A397UG63_9GLOM|nr:hypothetical protein C2G38_376184 [Gigaspora rosea]
MLLLIFFNIQKNISTSTQGRRVYLSVIVFIDGMYGNTESCRFAFFYLFCFSFLMSFSDTFNMFICYSFALLNRLFFFLMSLLLFLCQVLYIYTYIRMYIHCTSCTYRTVRYST